MCWGDQPPRPSASAAGTTPVGCTTHPCPCQCGDTRWLDTQVYCGDNARLQASFTGGCPDGPATVDVLHEGRAVDTINATLRAGRVDAVWAAKAPTANWRTDRIRFRVTAAGLTCTSSNEFTFRQRPTTAWVSRDINRGTPVGFAALCEKVDARLEANRVHYALKLKLAGAAFGAAKQTDAKSRIETIWNNGFSGKSYHRTGCRRGRACSCAFDCCKASFRLDANFVASGEHYAVTITPSPDPAHPSHSSTSCSGVTWADPPIAVTTSYAHEVGHMLGQFDEYTGGGVDPSGIQPTNPPEDTLMKTAGSTTLRTRHYRWSLEFLNANSGGDPYEIIPP